MKSRVAMKEEKLEKMLNELADTTAQPVRRGLADDIKHRIPHRLISHRGGLDTINIIVDLRISKLTAAAAIIITIVLCASFFGERDLTSGGVFHNSMLLIKHLCGLEGAGGNGTSVGRSKYEHLLGRGERVQWYGDSIDPQDSNAALMHWQLSNGKYGVFFVDGRETEVNAEQLIELLTQVLQRKTKR